jgi:protoheme IX farnesyltransferase
VATEPILILPASPAASASAGETSAIRAHAKFADYWALTKPEINFLIAIATFTGFYLGLSSQSHMFPYLLLLHTLLGTLLVASGTGTLNQYIERRFDAQMHRTARRPVAAGRIEPSNALWFAITLSAAGGIYLAVAVNALASVLAVFTLVSYLFVYTPLKRRSPLSTVVGAVPGAMPPLIGWAAASGRLSADAWVLYGILFLWQFPHFMAIAWMYRNDYDRAGYLVLPQGEQRIRWMTRQTRWPLLVLLPLSLTPAVLGDAGLLYLVGALLLGGGFLCYGSQFILSRSTASARRLLLASIVYLPSLYLLMILSRR